MTTFLDSTVLFPVTLLLLLGLDLTFVSDDDLVVLEQEDALDALDTTQADRVEHRLFRCEELCSLSLDDRFEAPRVDA